jgi:hypothetical protein
MELFSKSEAIAAGNHRYYDGSSCSRGHTSGRYVKNDECIGCACNPTKNPAPRRVRNGNLALDITVPGDMAAADRVVLLNYLQFQCVPAFLATRVKSPT